MILLDTDVLVDVALDRGVHADSAARLLDKVENGGVRAAVAWHSMSNFYYLVAPAHGGVRTRDFIVQLVGFVDVAKTGTDEMRYAAGLPLADFEDAVPYFAPRWDRPYPKRLYAMSDGVVYRATPIGRLLHHQRRAGRYRARRCPAIRPQNRTRRLRGHQFADLAGLGQHRG